LARDRAIGLAAAAVALLLIGLTPSFNPGAHDLWIRRDPELRALVDEVAARAQGRDVVWISEESGYFYACRVRPPLDRYHALPRPDSDPARLVEELRQVPATLAVVQQSELPRQRWEKLLELTASQWQAEPQFERGPYRVYVLQRNRPPD
jgi:hypothetical protein